MQMANSEEWSRFSLKELHYKSLDKLIYPNAFEWLFLKIPYNLGQNIWNKTEKSSKTWEERKALISTFASLLTAIAKF